MSYVLITGASSGLGKVFAQEYAAFGTNLILVARSEEKLLTLSAELRDKYNIDVRTFTQDLSLQESAEKVFAFCNREKLTVETLVNNAGFGLSGAFDSMPLESLEKMIILHNLTLMKLTYLFLPDMKHRNRGSVLNVSSITAFQGIPYNAVYAATKAFILTFSESIREELRYYGIKVCSLCPGLTETAIFDKAGIDPYQTLMPIGPPEPVVRAAINGLEKNRTIIIPGLINKILIHGGRLLPRSLMLKLGIVLGRNKKAFLQNSC